MLQDKDIKLAATLERFKVEMSSKLDVKADEKSGWDSLNFDTEDMKKQLMHHVETGNFVSAANFCLFAWAKNNENANDCKYDINFLINGEDHIFKAEVACVIISYEDICQYANENPEMNPSMTYSHEEYGEGSLTRGQTIALHEGMIFNCMVTGSA